MLLRQFSHRTVHRDIENHANFLFGFHQQPLTFGKHHHHHHLYPQHLKDMPSDATPGSSEVLDCLVDFINNIILAGIIPDNVCKIFYGASLMALSKKDNGVRPIAIGLTLRRLAGKVIMGKLRDPCITLLHPHQTGVGMKRGAEIATHALRQFMGQEHREDKVLVKIDFKNAFNTARRDVILRKVREETP